MSSDGSVQQLPAFAAKKEPSAQNQFVFVVSVALVVLLIHYLLSCTMEHLNGNEPPDFWEPVSAYNLKLNETQGNVRLMKNKADKEAAEAQEKADKAAKELKEAKDAAERANLEAKVKSDQANKVEGLGKNEPPKFWNPHNMNEYVNQEQRNSNLVETFITGSAALRQRPVYIEGLNDLPGLLLQTPEVRGQMLDPY